LKLVLEPLEFRSVFRAEIFAGFERSKFNKTVTFTCAKVLNVISPRWAQIEAVGEKTVGAVDTGFGKHLGEFPARGAHEWSPLNFFFGPPTFPYNSDLILAHLPSLV